MKKKEKTERTKEKIISAAMKEFGTKGYQASSLNNICSDYGISKGLIYHNFKNKDEIYLTCISRCFSAVAQYLENKNFGNDLQKYIEERFSFFTANPLYARLFFEAVLQPPPALAGEIKERKKDFDTLNRQIYRTALKALRLRDGVTEEDALKYYEIMQDMFNGYFNSSAYSAADIKTLISDHEEKLAKILNFMLYGIAKEGN